MFYIKCTNIGENINEIAEIHQITSKVQRSNQNMQKYTKIQGE
jgi:hypothetical protein